MPTEFWVGFMGGAAISGLIGIAATFHFYYVGRLDGLKMMFRLQYPEKKNEHE